jgi:hypothetical protein
MHTPQKSSNVEKRVTEIESLVKFTSETSLKFPEPEIKKPVPTKKQPTIKRSPSPKKLISQLTQTLPKRESLVKDRLQKRLATKQTQIQSQNTQT